MPTSILNTISEHLLEQKGVYWHGWTSQFVALPTNQEFAHAQKIDGLKVFFARIPPMGSTQMTATIPAQSLSLNQLHRRLAHLHVEGIQQFIRQEGLVLKDKTPFQPCPACALAKSTRIVCQEPHTRATRPFQKVHLDLCGPISISGLGNKRYFLLMTDDYSRFRWVTCLHSKDQTFSVVEQFFAATANQYSSTISELHCDNGTEFVKKQFQDFLAEKGCRMVTSAPSHHSQNGIAERANGVITEKARAMLIDSQLSAHLWPEAVATAVYLANRSPTSVNPDFQSPLAYLRTTLGLPFESNAEHLRAFGAVAYVHIPPEKRLKGEKFEPHAQRGYLVGYADGLNYRIWVPATHKVVVSAYITFDETPRSTPPSNTDFTLPVEIAVDPSSPEMVSISVPGIILVPEESPFVPVTAISVPSASAPPTSISMDVPSTSGSDFDSLTTDMTAPTNPIDAIPERESAFPVMSPPLGVISEAELTSDMEAELADTHPILRRSSRSNKGRPPTHFSSDHSATYAFLAHVPTRLLYSYSAALYSSHNAEVPRTHKEAMSRPDAAKWLEAEQLEIAQLEKLKVARLVPLPCGARLLPSKWVYSHKRTSGIYKARFVARGDKQRPGEDFDDTFASVVRPETFRTLMALIAPDDLEAKSFDVVTAFLYALMAGQAPIYICPPAGYEKYDKEGRLLVLLLLKALYGLRQSPRLWYLEITTYLALHGYIPLPSDPCVLRHSKGDLLVLWVDDIVTISSSLTGIDHIKGVLNSKYELREMGDLTEYLGLTIYRDRSNGFLYLAQNNYANKVLMKFHLENCLPLSAPSTGVDQLLPSTMESTHDQRQLYQALIGSLMYLAVWTRPDIAERCSRLGQFAHNPASEHHSSLRNVMAYIKGTTNLALRYQRYPSRGLEIHSLDFLGYSDSSFADNISDRKSTSGYLFRLAGGAISWKSRKQPVLTTSSTEAEYVAYSIACKEAVWLRTLL